MAEVEKKKKEMNSLEIHEEMYRRRLFVEKLREGKSPQELRNIANDPRHFRRRGENKEETPLTP